MDSMGESYYWQHDGSVPNSTYAAGTLRSGMYSRNQSMANQSMASRAQSMAQSMAPESGVLRPGKQLHRKRTSLQSSLHSSHGRSDCNFKLIWKWNFESEILNPWWKMYLITYTCMNIIYPRRFFLSVISKKCREDFVPSFGRFSLLEKKIHEKQLAFQQKIRET
jgi:hypothetical protein